MNQKKRATTRGEAERQKKAKQESIASSSYEINDDANDASNNIPTTNVNKPFGSADIVHAANAKTVPRDFYTQNLLAAFEEANVSDENAVEIIDAFAECLGIREDEYEFDAVTLAERRKMYREQKLLKMRAELEEAANAKKGPRDIYTQDLLAAIELCNITDVDAVEIVDAMAESLGMREDEYDIDVDTLAERRKIYREQQSKKTKGKKKKIVVPYPT